MTTFAEMTARGAILINDGYRTKASELGAPGFPILRVAEIGDGVISPSYGDNVRDEYRDQIGYKLSRTGDVLLTTKGTVGRRALMPELATEFAYSPQLCSFRVLDNSIDNRWLYYWLGGTDFWRQAIGVSQQTDMAPYISLRDLRAISIDIPPIEEQRAIASTLGALDDKIKSNQRAIELGLSLLDSFSEREAALLPTVQLRELTSLNRATASPSALGDAVVDHFSLPAFDHNARPEAVPAVSIMSNKIRVTKPGILVSRLNPRTNRTWWVAPRAGVASLASTEFACLTADDDASLAGLWLAVRYPYFREELTRRVTGTSGSHQRVRPDDLTAIEVPDVRLLVAGVKHKALALLEEVGHHRNESAALMALRDALLPELVSGRMRVLGLACFTQDEQG